MNDFCLCTVCLSCLCINISLAPSTGVCLVLMTKSLLTSSSDLRDPTTAQPSKSHVCQTLLTFFFLPPQKVQIIKHFFFVLVASLGISSELQAKLQDVMILRNLLSIGKVLGEGEDAAWSGVVLQLMSDGFNDLTSLLQVSLDL